jgi:hypothetical protein
VKQGEWVLAYFTNKNSADIKLTSFRQGVSSFSSLV